MYLLITYAPAGRDPSPQTLGTRYCISASSPFRSQCSPRACEIPFSFKWQEGLGFEPHTRALFWTLRPSEPIKAMATRRAILRTIPALPCRATVPRPRLQTFKMTSSTEIPKRRLHATAQHLKPATGTVLSTLQDYPTFHEQIDRPIDTPGQQIRPFESFDVDEPLRSCHK